MIRIFGLKACDTCRKAVKETGGELVDIRANPLSRGELEQFQAEFGAALLNTRSTTWRGLDEAQRTRDPIDLMLEKPALMKRPVIETEGSLYLGFGADVKGALLG